MAKIMLLAESGFGKTTSLGANPHLGIKGLNPARTLLIQASKKGLPFPGNKKNYTPVRVGPNEQGVNALLGNLFYAPTEADAIKQIQNFIQYRPEVDIFVIDDFNFFMQDYYMRESGAKKGFKVFEEIGTQTSQFFNIFDQLDALGKTIIVLAHAEIYEDIEGRKRFRIKTVGNAVNNFVTPEGRFEIVLMGKSNFDVNTKTVSKMFVTNDDGFYNAKSPYGMFTEKYILNDMGLVIDCIDAYDNGQ